MEIKARDMETACSATTGGGETASRKEIIIGLRSSLDAIPEEGRGVEWLKASIYVNCLFRHAADVTFRQLQDLRKALDAAAFDSFVNKVLTVLHPHTLSPHGYKMAMGSRDSRENWKAVAKIGATLEELGVDWFINSGTLLGAIRDNDFIAHDDDVDLAVLLPGNDAETIVQNWFMLKDALRERDMLAVWNSKGQIHFKVKARFGVDIFPCWIIEDRVFIWPHTHGEIGVDDLLPLGRRSMGSTAVKVPCMPEKVLELNYGPDWRSPNPAWKFPWAAACKKFQDFRVAHRAAKKHQVLP